MAPMTKLVLVENSRQVSASHRTFVRDLGEAKELAMDLVRRTRYWVYDPIGKTFSPSKFSGYTGMDFVRYNSARMGEATGVKFDGGVTQRAISQVLGEYEADAELVRELETWAVEIFGPRVLDGINPGKWQFARLPERGNGGLVALAGGWEGSDQLVDSVLQVRRTPGRNLPDIE